MTLFNAKKAVFFGAHTDDEMVAAGTLHRLVREGCKVGVVTFSPAAIQGDRAGGWDSVKVVCEEWDESLRVIGASHSERDTDYLSFFCGEEFTPSAELPDHRQEICQFVYEYCEKHRPDLAFILSPFDENTAHAVVGVECERVMRGRVPTVLRCDFPWNYGKGGRPNLYVKLDVTDGDAKRRVINCYQSQKFRYDYEAMLMHYAYADGLSVKAAAAERFEVVRSVL